jgi:hypothetical protein
MNGIVKASRTLGGKLQTVTGIGTNTNAAGIRNGFQNLFSTYLRYIQPASGGIPINTTDFDIDSELITPSPKSDRVVTLPMRIYFTVTIDDSTINFPETMMLYADIEATGTYPGYDQMNTAFKDYQYQKTGVTKFELCDPEVFVNDMICVL